MPALVTTLEVFCLRTGRVFKVKGSAVVHEQYEAGWGREINHYRCLVPCKRCPDTHLLLTTYQAACFGLIGDPVGGEWNWTRRHLSFGHRNNSHLFDRKRFPPVEHVAADGSKKAA